ncbi:GNAT family N-acetyltransferase [Sanguibacter sp. A247]|uniref:GNAT family N-acetyltransferase n=1 Tax=unclassified Sanguibacter TaxID=2645534 RepID=UPI003FD73F32
MMRASIDVRHAVASDLQDVAALCLTAREESSTPTQLCSADAEHVRRQLGVLISVPGGRILVARHDGVAVGFLLGRIVEANIYHDTPVLYIEALFVDQVFRRRGAGHALLGAAAEIAGEVGADEVYSVPLPGSRGVQRFLLRLGFAPAGAHRVVQTAMLVRKLEGEPALARRGSRGLEDLIARRRKARIETHSGPVDLRELQARLRAERAASPSTPEQGVPIMAQSAELRTRRRLTSAG